MNVARRNSQFLAFTGSLLKPWDKEFIGPRSPLEQEAMDMIDRAKNRPRRPCRQRVGEFEEYDGEADDRNVNHRGFNL